MDDVGCARNATVLTPSDATAQAAGMRAIYVGGAGDITLRAAQSSADVVFKACPVGLIIPIKASYVRATGTTATLLLALA